MKEKMSFEDLVEAFEGVKTYFDANYIVNIYLDDDLFLQGYIVKGEDFINRTESHFYYFTIGGMSAHVWMKYDLFTYELTRCED